MKMDRQGDAKRPVVVTGMGCLTPLGNDLETTWWGIRNGQSGIGPITRFDASRLRTRIAGEVRGFDPTSVLDVKEVRRLDRFQQFAIVAAVEALMRAELAVTPEIAERVGVVVGSGIGGFETLVRQHEALYRGGPRKINPFLMTMIDPGLASGLVALHVGAKGPNHGTVSACATGAYAIGEAFEVIRRGDADVMLAGGSEAAIVEIGMASFSNMHALSTRNDCPQAASRPFDVERDGFVMSEGAGVLVLEDMDHARQRNAPILAELVGYGSTADAHHRTEPAPGGEGAARAMRQALERSGLCPRDVDYINAHATSTPAGDPREAAAIRSVFGAHADQMAVSSTKSMTGHLVGAAGAVETIFCVKALQDEFIPPTINLDHLDPECDLDVVAAGRDIPLDVVMNNAYGFGGHNVSLVLRRVDQPHVI